MEVERGLLVGIAGRAAPGLGPGMAAEEPVGLGPEGLGPAVESGTCCVRGCGAAGEAGRAALG